MDSKLDAGVVARLREAERSGRPQEIAVIVTLRPGVSWEALREQGLQVRHVFANIHAVSGQVQTPRIQGIASLEWVQRIEFDSEARALPSDPE